MSKFFISPECIKGGSALIVAQEAHHILDVLRLKKGDRITAFDGSGKLYEGKISETAHKQVKLKIERVRQDLLVSTLTVTLVQALPKKNRMDYIIEKCTELGIDSIIPTETTRTIVRLDRKRQLSRQRRWQRIATEAAKQCGRLRIPRVEGLTAWTKVLSMLSDYDLKMLACLNEKTQKLKDVLCMQNKARTIILCIGPEGDFTPEEIAQACAKGCITVSLGRNILKSDTAAVSALAMINYELRQ